MRILKFFGTSVVGRNSKLKKDGDETQMGLTSFFLNFLNWTVLAREALWDIR